MRWRPQLTCCKSNGFAICIDIFEPQPTHIGYIFDQLRTFKLLSGPSVQIRLGPSLCWSRCPRYCGSAWQTWPPQGGHRHWNLQFLCFCWVNDTIESGRCWVECISSYVLTEAGLGRWKSKSCHTDRVPQPFDVLHHSFQWGVTQACHTGRMCVVKKSHHQDSCVTRLPLFGPGKVFYVTNVENFSEVAFVRLKVFIILLQIDAIPQLFHAKLHDGHWFDPFLDKLFFSFWFDPFRSFSRLPTKRWK